MILFYERATKFLNKYLMEYPLTTFKEFKEKCKVYNVCNNIPENERIKMFFKHSIQVHQEASEKIRKDLYKKICTEIKKQIDLQREYSEAKREASRVLLEKEKKIIEQKVILKKVEDRIKDKTFKILNSMDIDRAWAQGRLDLNSNSLVPSPDHP